MPNINRGLARLATHVPMRYRGIVPKGAKGNPRGFAGEYPTEDLSNVQSNIQAPSKNNPGGLSLSIANPIIGGVSTGSTINITNLPQGFSSSGNTIFYQSPSQQQAYSNALSTSRQSQSTLDQLNALIKSGNATAYTKAAFQGGQNLYTTSQQQLNQSQQALQANAPVPVADVLNGSIVPRGSAVIPVQITGSLGKGGPTNLGTVFEKPSLDTSGNLVFTYKGFQPQNVTTNVGGTVVSAPTKFNPLTNQISQDLLNYNYFSSTGKQAPQNSASTVNATAIYSPTAFPGKGTYNFFTGTPPSDQSFSFAGGKYTAGNPNLLLTPSGNVIVSNQPKPFLSTYISNPTFLSSELSNLNLQGKPYYYNYTLDKEPTLTFPFKLPPTVAQVQSQTLPSSIGKQSYTDIINGKINQDISSTKSFFGGINNFLSSKVSGANSYLLTQGLVFTGPGSTLANAFGYKNPAVVGLATELTSLPLTPYNLYETYTHPTQALDSLTKQITTNPLGFIGQTVGTAVILGTATDILSPKANPYLPATGKENFVIGDEESAFKPNYYGKFANAKPVGIFGSLKDIFVNKNNAISIDLTKSNLPAVITNEETNGGVSEILNSKSNIQNPESESIVRSGSQQQIQIQKPVGAMTGSQLAKFYASYGGVQQKGGVSTGGVFTGEQFRDLLAGRKTISSTYTEEPNYYGFSLALGQTSRPTRIQILNQLARTPQAQTSTYSNNLIDSITKSGQVSSSIQINKVSQSTSQLSISKQLSGTSQTSTFKQLQFNLTGQKLIQSESAIQKSLLQQLQLSLLQQLQFQNQVSQQKTMQFQRQSQRDTLYSFLSIRPHEGRKKQQINPRNSFKTDYNPDISSLLQGIKGQRGTRGRQKATGLFRPIY